MVLVGAVSVLLAYAAFLVLIVIGVHYLLASIGSFVTYWVINFILNKRWAFKSVGNGRRQALAHVSLHLGNQVLILAGLYGLVELATIPAAWSQIIMQVVVTLTAFIITPIIFKAT